MIIRSRAVLTCGLIVSLAGACSDPVEPPPFVRVNSAPEVNAGPDIMVPLPGSSASLRGHAVDAENNIESYSWSKVFGPDSYAIRNPGSVQTEVTDLEPGTYAFELSVRDRGGLTGSDTVGIRVYDPRTPGKSEFVFQNVAWSCPMGCWVRIDEIYRYFPPDTAIRVFLQQPGTEAWIEAVPEAQWTSTSPYAWGIYSGHLVIWSDETEGTVHVKITL